MSIDRSYLPKCTNFLDFRKWSLFQILGSTGSCLEGVYLTNFRLTGSSRKVLTGGVLLYFLIPLTDNKDSSSSEFEGSATFRSHET